MHIAVVGAGPAGAWAAYTLARRGARVTIFDPSHPREKPCGGGVTGRALALVAEAVSQRDLPVTVVRSARFVDSRRGDAATVAFDDAAAHPSLVVASRAAFDAALIAAAVHAGASLDRSRVTDVAVAAAGVRISTTAGDCDADFVIGADGANSLVRRRMTRAFAREQLSIATGFFARGITSAEIVVELVGDPPGYLWSFPRPDHLAIGICAQADAGITAGTLRATTARWIRTARLADGARLDPYSWPIPSLDARACGRLELAGSRWVLIGDAAGLVDPITREGIYFALLSAEWAADALSTGHCPDAYVARVQEEIGSELARAARLKAGFFRPAFIGLMLHALQQSEAVRAVMADLIAGRQDYRTLRWRLLKTLELSLAWQLVVSGRRSRPVLAP